MNKVGMFLDEIKDSNISTSEKFKKVGLNTGNMLFWHSLKTNLDLDIKSPWYTFHPENLKISDYKAFVCTDLIWIRQMVDFSYLNRILDVLGDLPLVPISVGLQAENYNLDFKLHPGTVNVLKRISERCVMGVRGNYTAEILSKNGITNFEVIGCPSMFMLGGKYDKLNNLPKKIENVTTNCVTFCDKLNQHKVDFLTYCAKHNFSFTEQTQAVLSEKCIPDGQIMSGIKDWIDAKSNCFFDIEAWRKYMRGFDFSMGMRFHGNVIALWEGVPSLFITCDSRTKELCEFYSLPNIDAEEFDPSKPVEYYYELADYTKFQAEYPKKLRNWENFLEINGLNDNISMLQYIRKDLKKIQLQNEALNIKLEKQQSELDLLKELLMKS